MQAKLKKHIINKLESFTQIRTNTRFVRDQYNGNFSSSKIVDYVKGADEAFKILAVSYNLLKDPSQRKQYDEQLADGKGQINTSYLKDTRDKVRYYMIQ